MEWAAISSSRGSSQPKIEPASPVVPAFTGRFFTIEPPGKPLCICVPDATLMLKMGENSIKKKKEKKMGENLTCVPLTGKHGDFKKFFSRQIAKKNVSQVFKLRKYVTLLNLNIK